MKRKHIFSMNVSEVAIFLPSWLPASETLSRSREFPTLWILVKEWIHSQYRKEKCQILFLSLP